MPEHDKADIGLIGLAVMGQNIVLNMESRGYTVAVHNRTTSVTERFMEERAQGRNILPAYQSPAELVGMLKRPRKVMIMVRAGSAIDSVIGQVSPHLDEGDLIIDGGNSHFQDTRRREQELAEQGILFIGTGISGGEEGALYGPSIMPGGRREGYELIKDIFDSIAARADGSPCSDYMGAGGAGHFVKMVHNGIEYGDMQLIAESYHILKVMGLTEPEIADVYGQWADGRLDSYLIEIASDVLRQKDHDGDGYLVQSVLDSASQKGTGMWTAQTSLELGVPAPTIYAAVAARVMSALRDERQRLSGALPVSRAPADAGTDVVVERLEGAMYSARIATYAQGMRLIQEAAPEYDFGQVDLGRIAEIWRAGCIIRARLLNDVTAAYRQDPDLTNLIQSELFAEPVSKALDDLAWVGKLSRDLKVATPAMDASLSYLLSMTSAELPGASLVQALRDYFGAHTYRRKDRDGVFHTAWMEEPRRELKISDD